MTVIREAKAKGFSLSNNDHIYIKVVKEGSEYMLEEFEEIMEEIWINKVLQEAEDNLWKMRCPLETKEEKV